MHGLPPTLGHDEKHWGSDVLLSVRTAGTTSGCTGLPALLADAVRFWVGDGGPTHAACTARASVTTARRREWGHAGAKHSITKPTRKYKNKIKSQRYSWTFLTAKTYSCCTDLKTVRDIINKRRASFNSILRDNDLQSKITVKPSKLSAESRQFPAGHLAVYTNQSSELERAYCLVQCSQHVVGMLTGAERGKNL